MDLKTTAIVMVIVIALYGISLWQSKRPVILGKIRYVPWPQISFISLLAALFLLVHFLTLLKQYLGGY
ncbi:hypothetical protein [Pseudaquidulcibacter saccharophilus]|uniref:hypothetical protein n=1 Tax=Pseudaquidulcibacter saccharophilus TaxID=2831900 RepID=UPI001EFF5B4B|nr:hypothetical protein [Pseudaquidulcibacter saccharophilus]